MAPRTCWLGGLALCANNQFVVPAFRTLRRRGAQTMTPQRFLQILGRTAPDDMLEIVGDILEASVGLVASSGRLKEPVKVAVDERLILYHGGGDRHKGGKRKGGTNRFEGYITVQVVFRRLSVTFSVYLIASGKAQPHYPEGFIENVWREKMDIDIVLPDRGFNSVANMLEMVRLGVKYAMPLSGSTKMCSMMKEVDSGPGATVRLYTMANRNGESATTLVIVPKKSRDGNGKAGPARIQNRYVAFLTNVEMDSAEELLRYIPKTYASAGA